MRAPQHAIPPDPACTMHMLMCPRARVRCVCAGSLLLLVSSIDEAESLPEAAVHRPRVRAASRHVVGVAEAAPCASPALLRVLLAVVGGGLERVGALRDAGVGQNGRLLVRAGRVWCPWSTWGQ